MSLKNVASMFPTEEKWT